MRVQISYTLIVLPNGITMARERRLNIRLTDKEWEGLKADADKKGLRMAEVIRFCRIINN